MSDRLGYIYWFAVLTTISCGCTTGIFVTLTNKHEMINSCHEKYQIYEQFIAENHIDVGNSFRSINQTQVVLHGHDEILDIENRIELIDQQLRYRI